MLILAKIGLSSKISYPTVFCSNGVYYMKYIGRRLVMMGIQRFTTNIVHVTSLATGLELYTCTKDY